MTKKTNGPAASPAPEKTATGEPKRTGSLLSIDFPSVEQWKALLQQFSSEAVAHKLLLAHVPFVFRNEPLKFALFRRTIADAFGVAPTNVFIVGSAMAGRSLKGRAIDKEYSSESDIDTLIVSEPLFTEYVMRSLEWVAEVTGAPRDDSGQVERDTDGNVKQAQLDDRTTRSLHFLATHAQKGIWRPDDLPPNAGVRRDFFSRFERISLHTLGLQLSDDTVAKVNGRIARSFEDAVKDLGNSLYRLRKELEEAEDAATTGDD